MTDAIVRGDITRPRPTASTSSTTKESDGSKPDPAAQKQTSSTAIALGKYTIIAPSAILRPPARQTASGYTPYPLKIGDHVLVGPNSVISAAQVHSHVIIGARCILQPFCVIRENVRILDDSVVPAGMVVPPGVVVAGRPARIVDDVGEGWGVEGAKGADWTPGGDLKEVVRGVK
jgi:dynactin-5